MSDRVLPRPTPEQIDFMNREIGVIIHLDLQVFEPTYDWRSQMGYTPSPAVFNPPSLDTDQWIRTAAAAGAKYVIFVAKHCGGFSMWPTKQHSFSVASSPWKDGKGDLVADVQASCRKYGLKMGIYCSFVCNAYYHVGGNLPALDEDARKTYNDMCMGQLRELWTNYGDLFEVWFDGGVPTAEEGGPDVASLIGELQPRAIVFGRTGRHVNCVRHGGEENGRAMLPAWGTVSDQKQRAGDPNGGEYCPIEADIANRNSLLGAFQGGWFWQANQEHSVRPAAELLDCYYSSVGRNANLLIGMCIDNRGLVDEADRRVFEDFGTVVKRINSLPRDTVSGTGCVFELPVMKYEEITEIVLREDFTQGERVRAYTIEALSGGVWRKVAEGQGIGHKRLITLSRTPAEKLRLTVTETVGEPIIEEFSAYFRRPVCSAPKIRRSDAGIVSIEPIPEAEIRYTTDGSVPTMNSALYTGPFEALKGGTVRAASFPLEGDDPMFPELKTVNSSTLAFGDCDKDWKVVWADSVYDEFNPPENMMSSECKDPWISGKNAVYPHAVIVDMLEKRPINGFVLTPLWNPGYFVRYAFYVGDELGHVDRLVDEGVFSDIGNMPVQQIKHFDKPVSARYYKIVALEPWTASSPYASIGRMEII